MDLDLKLLLEMDGLYQGRYVDHIDVIKRIRHNKNAPGGV